VFLDAINFCCTTPEMTPLTGSRTGLLYQVLIAWCNFGTDIAAT